MDGKYNSLLKTIDQIRIEKGLTRRKLAELCELEEAQFSKYMNGKNMMPVSVLIRIASELGVKII